MNLTDRGNMGANSCPLCKSTDISQGYGLAAGPMAAYIFCNSCDELIGLDPDLDGVDDETAARLSKAAEEWRTQLEQKIKDKHGSGT